MQRPCGWALASQPTMRPTSPDEPSLSSREVLGRCEASVKQQAQQRVWYWARSRGDHESTDHLINIEHKPASFFFSALLPWWCSGVAMGPGNSAQTKAFRPWADHETSGSRSWPPISVPKKMLRKPLGQRIYLLTSYMHMVPPPDRPFAS